MDKIRSVISLVRQFAAPAPPAVQQEIRYVRPFFWLVMLVLAFLYGLALYSSTALREPVQWAIFTLLMIVHGMLHWRLPRLAYSNGVAALYLVVQGILALVLSWLSHNVTFPLALAAILIGETVGVIRELRFTIPLVALQLALALLGHISLAGWRNLPSWWIPALPITGFVILYVALFNRQADARQQAQALLKELEETHKQLAEYSIRVEELTRSAERERLARDLHDTLAQGVAGLVLQLEAVKNHLDNERIERAREIIDLSLQRARSTLSESRAAIDNLRQRAGSFSLDEIVREHAAQFRHTVGIPCEVNSRLTEPMMLTRAASEHIERIMSEALFNILRHAQATQVRITIEQTKQEVSLQIEDNGVGFDPARSERSGQYGLLGIQERTRLLGGTSEVDSQPGKGARITLRIPTPVDERSSPHE